jgi:hypothetical protein
VFQFDASLFKLQFVKLVASWSQAEAWVSGTGAESGNGAGDAAHCDTSFGGIVAAT